jgi:hypothetical protein
MERKIRSISELDDKLMMLNRQHITKLNRLKRVQAAQARKFEKEVRKTTATAIASAFSFIIALFWRDAIQDLITKILELFGLTNSGYIAKLIAAAIVTVIGVLAIMRISKWGQVNKGKLMI